MIAIKALLAGMAAVSVCMAISISGIVTDTGGIPIAGAKVYLEQNKDSATSGPDGRFTISGLTGIKNQISKITPKLSASINNGFLFVNLEKNSEVEISAYNLQGKLLATIQKNVDAGNQSIALPQMKSGVYLYKVKMGKNEILLKSNTADGVVQGSVVSEQSVMAHNGLAKQAKVMATINDVITSTKTGYLDYRCVQYSSDTSGLQIKMIVCADAVRDIDGNLYHAVRIGGQVWTVENLRTTKYNDGTAITKIMDSAAWYNIYNNNLTTPAYCYYNNTTNADSITKFGALYNWYAVNTGKLAPAGWHVPTDSEWEVMQSYLVMHGYNYDGTTDTTNNKIAIALAAKTDWYSYTGAGYPGNNLTKNNSSGFSALPGGFRNKFGVSGGIGIYGYWWSSDVYFSALEFNYDHRSSYMGYFIFSTVYDYRSFGYSVRLVKNN